MTKGLNLASQATMMAVKPRPPAVLVEISFLLAFLGNGAGEIASRYNLNDYAAQMIEGVILFFILGSEFFINYRLVLRGHEKEGAKA